VPDEPLARRHKPKPGKYRDYSDCLRWEFGFSCAFCLVHDRDLNEHGLKGFGQMWVEHYVTQHQRPDLADTYSNCFYSCRFCNQSRSDTPHRRGARRLLNPCTTAWSDHFELQGDHLVPTSDDGRFTEEIYDLNEERRILLRQNRNKTLKAAIRLIVDGPRVIRGLQKEAEGLPWGPLRSQNFLAAQLLRTELLNAHQEIRRFRAIPVDAPTECRGKDDERVLPRFLQDQVIDVDVTVR